MTQSGPDCAAAAPLRPLTEGEFAAVQSLVHREAGIWLSDAKRALVVGRLQRRLRDLSLSTFTEYLDRVRVEPRERVEMLNCICTNETHFFREPAHFDLLERFILPLWRDQAGRGERAKSARVWSAGCSTGEEPYSLAMLLLDQLSGWDIQILATDLSTRALDRAVAGEWPVSKTAEIPKRYLRYMLRGTRSQDGKMKAGAAVQAAVAFQQINLNDPRVALIGRFDLVFCRNVMIYFDAQTKASVCERLLDHLRPDGYLFVGHAESLAGITPRVESVIPTVYRLKASS